MFVTRINAITYDHTRSAYDSAFVNFVSQPYENNGSTYVKNNIGEITPPYYIPCAIVK